MYFATIDCGTTNSRVYVLDDRLRVVAKGVKKVGVRDTAITGSRRALQEGLGSGDRPARWVSGGCSDEVME